MPLLQTLMGGHLLPPDARPLQKSKVPPLADLRR
jgi:hypothetical protein